VAAVAGGLAAPLTKERAESFRSLVQEAVPLGLELVGVAKAALVKQMDLVTSLPLETSYLGTVNDGALDLYEGDLRLRRPNGESFDFSEEDWRKHIHEETVATSYAKYVFFDNGQSVPYRVGPLARLNVADRMSTPLAHQELEEFRTLGGHPCHQTVMYHYARLIEMLNAAETLALIAKDDEILSENVRTLPSGTPKSATAHVEAPRGVLIHDYEVDSNGIVEKANLIVATQQNVSSINRTVGLSAQKYLDKPDDVLLNAIEFGVRCYDPCLSCATHRVGEMRLDVVVRQDGKIIRRATR
jgi:F420-non-reducing hydrogenase large subunit